MPTFRFDVCCPDAGCGVYQQTLNWLRSLGFEPALGCDEDGHYMVVELPVEANDRRRIKFFWELAHRYEGIVYCRCGHWHQSQCDGRVTHLTCEGCGTGYEFCDKCDALARWRGCKCGKGRHAVGR